VQSSGGEIASTNASNQRRLSNQLGELAAVPRPGTSWMLERTAAEWWPLGGIAARR
jgi:hypothetical protein